MRRYRDNRSNQYPDEKRISIVAQISYGVNQLRYQLDTNGGRTNTVLQRKVEISAPGFWDLLATLNVGEVIEDESGQLIRVSILRLGDKREIRLAPYEHAMLAEHAPCDDDLTTAAGLQRYTEYLEDEQMVLDDVCARLEREGFMFADPSANEWANPLR